MIVSINIPDTVAPRVLTAICGVYDYAGYLATTKDTPPLTQAQFSKREVIRFIISTIIKYEVDAAVGNESDQLKQAAITAQNKVNTDITLT